MRTSNKGLADIMEHEGVVLSPYRDIVGVWTIGVGHTASAGPPDPRRIGQISMAEAVRILRADVRKSEERVARAFTTKLSQHEFDAAVSFDINTGGILRATWVQAFNRGDLVTAHEAFMNWSKPAAIIPRREKERDLFFKAKYVSDGRVPVYWSDPTGKINWTSAKMVNVWPILGSQPPAERDEPVSRPSTPGNWLTRILAALMRFFKGEKNGNTTHGTTGSNRADSDPVRHRRSGGGGDDQSRSR